ncbi:olfactory receptor 10AD1-like [Tupaia chinensis]|uniref:olfactory receptor 10AD1-like n=1 Tax=Tupaia chinensis TaxID=246437 RepID=UPI0003C8DA78|nr:olfactory receptor 10AD1-like [Tupaia chinensis]
MKLTKIREEPISDAEKHLMTQIKDQMQKYLHLSTMTIKAKAKSLFVMLKERLDLTMMLNLLLTLNGLNNSRIIIQYIILQAVDPRNSSTVTEFILVGFEQSSPSTRALLFALFLTLYSLAMAMNGLIIFITWTDPRLNSPMYFFLGHLSFLDVCFITTTIPQMLIHLVVKNHTVSFVSCMIQMYLVFCAGVAECILLAFMAYDRYVAICHPLCYAQIMSRQVCVRLVGAAWFFGLINGILLEYMSFRNPFCKDNHIENFFCEAPIVIALSCGDPQFSMKIIFADAIVVLLSPMVLIVTSYARILASILGRASSSGWGKTFSTCASHLTVVVCLYTSAMFSYMNPRSTHGPDKDKPFSLLYTIITPMCNPIIYSFRNKEMKGAMVRALWRTSQAQAESV